MTRLLKPKEVAEVLSISEREVRDLCAAGDLRAGKLRGRLWRIHPDDLDAYVRDLRGLTTPASVKKASTA
jgi:excisionase family DNA binding protein